MKTILLISILALTTSCATMFTGTKQTITIESEPSGATVRVNGINRGTTPLPIELNKGEEGEILTLELEGYKNQSIQPITTFNSLAVLNLLSLIGWAVDYATGAMWMYDPIMYNVILESE